MEKITFTPKILQQHNFGLFIIKADVKDIEDIKQNPSYAATVSYKLGYTNHQFVNHNRRYGLINFLSDGWFYPAAEDIVSLCDYLNNNPHGDTYRILTREEIIYLITNRSQGFYPL